jgi:hypothetical protein
MVSAIIVAAVVELGWQVFGKRQVYLPIVATAVTLLVLGSSLRVADAAAGLAEYTRVLRVPFRDIARQHPSFPADTYLYFVYPSTPVTELEGLFYTRYFGAGVAVDGTDTGHLADLRRHNASYVYYFDKTGRPIEIPVDPNDGTRAAPPLPATFQVPITLEGYAVPSRAIQRDQALVVILTWSTATQVNKDYAVFAHLVDSNGAIIAEYDAQPQRGKTPTSAWQRGQKIVDALVLPLDPGTPLGENYRLEVGMYDRATMQRLSVVDKDGRPVDDKIVIGPFSIVQ